ncbi:MAG TPA: recombination protein O N-terminal domain-containing protein [Candidatus Paceibacterota bacterium]|nr:recombination protein O N-terminal domain-containing protein [Candidatus Paceibacterota bacterium]
MSYQTYQTEAVVLRSGNMREANRYYHLLTREFGVIQATAQAVRKEASKLRYSLQDLTRTEVTLVRGREWRIVGAREPEHWWRTFAGEPQKLRLLARLAALVVRLSPEAGGNEYLYDTLLASAEKLRKEMKDEEEVFLSEILLVARFLYSLGYLPLRSEYAELFRDTLLSERLPAAALHKKLLLQDINTALKASQL